MNFCVTYSERANQVARQSIDHRDLSEELAQVQKISQEHNVTAMNLLNVVNEKVGKAVLKFTPRDVFDPRSASESGPRNDCKIPPRWNNTGSRVTSSSIMFFKK
jgi:hypothetical protein